MKIYVLTYNGTVVRAFALQGEGVHALLAARSIAPSKHENPGLWELTECTLYGQGQGPIG